MKIVIEKYNPKWVVAFDKESRILLESIQESNVIVEHIGSTSVIGLGAKPIIDIMIGLVDFKTIDNHIEPIEKLGYDYMAAYNKIMPYRRFFKKEKQGIRTHHIHMVAQGTEFWKRHILFRNHLRENPIDRDLYMRLKMDLAEKEWADMNDYADAKSNFIRKIESKF